MSFEYSKLTKVLTVAAAVVSIAACGGGGGDPVRAPEATVNGLAAVGAPVVGAQVLLRCANNVTGQTTTDSEGGWTLEVANAQFPCLATLSNSTSHARLTLRSLALETGYLNITPLTELFMARAAAQSSLSLDNVDTQGLLTLSSSLETAMSDVIAILVAQGL